MYFMKKILGLSIFLIGLANALFAQTSSINGNWTTGSTWTGGNAPGAGWTTINVGHTVSKTSGHSVAGTLNINSPNGNVTFNGNLSVSGGSTVNVYGTLTVTGSITLNSNLVVHPGGKVIVEGSVTVNNAQYLTIGSNAAPPPYADMIIMENLISQSSGDIIINQNGRLAVFGNVTDSGGGGTFLRVNNGGQVYVHGNVAFSGGSSAIQNNNTTSPYGLYVNGTTTSTGGGGSVTPNLGDQTTLTNTNPTFFDWIANQSGSPLPVELLYFAAKAEGGLVKLMWATASQLNFDYFSIEHSTNGEEWSAIARIDGAGTTNEILEYSYNHQALFQGVNYYRLKSIDFDETFEYSFVVAATIEVEKSISVYPNPASGTDQISFELNFAPIENDMIIIVDLMGVEVTRVYVASSVEKISLPSLRSGTYLMRYVGSNFEQTSRLVIR